MHKILFSVLLICAMVCCKGIDLRMHRGARSSPKVRNSCGILTCTQTNNVNDSYSTAVNDRASPGILFSSIQRMSLFISKGERIAEIGSITETSPILKSVVNGKKTEGLLEPGRATMRLELVKEDDCMADFICDVHGLDNQGKQVLSSISLKQHFEPKQTGSQTFDPVLLLNSVQQIVNSLEAKIEKRFSKLEKDLEYKSGSLYRKLDRKILELQKNVNNRSDKSDIMISQLQDNLNSKIGSLENVTELQNKTQSAEDQRQFFESDMNMKIDRIEDKLGSCNRDKLNKLNKIDAKVSKVIAMFDDDTVKKRLGFVADLLERSTEGQREVLENFTQTIQQGLNNASLLFTSVKGDIDRYGQYGLEQLAVVKNRTDMIYDTLTFEEVPTPCLKNNTSLAVQDTLVIIIKPCETTH